jgi:hypothetical protein
MRTAAFLLETLGHFIKLDASPPPGVPVHAGDEFEKRLMALCQAQGLAPIVLDSFDHLSLLPKLSRITLERLRGMAQITAGRTAHVLKLGDAIAASFAREEISCRFIGALVSAATLYPQPNLRRVEPIELLVQECDWLRIESLLKDQGFVLPVETPSFAGFREVLEYYQYASPCLFRHRENGTVALRFRMNAYGPPEADEPVWRREWEHPPNSGSMAILPHEDRLIQAVLEWNASGMSNLLLLADIGLLLRRRRSDIDWDYIGGRLRESGFYSGFCLALEHAVELLHIPAVLRLPVRPGALKREFFKTAWLSGSNDYLRTGEDQNPLKHFLLECGMFNRKIRLLKRLFSPETSWVTARSGRPFTLWSKIKYTVMLLRGNTRVSSAMTWNNRG